jgi:hypothetical protein
LLILIALTKRALLTPDIKPSDQILLLEKMGELTDVRFTQAVIAAVAPASDTECEIVKEARSLDAPGNKDMASYKVLSSPRVFSGLAALNPSLLAAIRLMEHFEHKAPSVAEPQEHHALPVIARPRQPDEEPDWVKQAKRGRPA